MKIIDLKKKLGDFQMDIPYLSLEKGLVHGIIGGNGCGKTTLCKLMMGILQPDEGYIDYEGFQKGKITMTMQKPYFLEGSVYENICYPLKLRKQKINEQAIDEWLQKCDLADKKNQYARSLSSGEQQKLSMLRGLIFHPDLMIVDETLSNLDPEGLEFFKKTIIRMQRERALTWIIISHRLALIYKLCDQIHFMQKGRVLESGESRQVLFASGHEPIRRFVENEVIVEGRNGIIKG